MHGSARRVMQVPLSGAGISKVVLSLNLFSMCMVWESPPSIERRLRPWRVGEGVCAGEARR